jgi:hypothetical protein
MRSLGGFSRRSLDCFNALHCRHLARVDFILTDDGVPYVLEINTLPGFTSHSLLPMAARKAGIPTPVLCRRIVEAAWTPRTEPATPYRKEKRLRDQTQKTKRRQRLVRFSQTRRQKKTAGRLPAVAKTQKKG